MRRPCRVRERAQQRKPHDQGRRATPRCTCPHYAASAFYAKQACGEQRDQQVGGGLEEPLNYEEVATALEYGQPGAHEAQHDRERKKQGKSDWAGHGDTARGVRSRWIHRRPILVAGG